MGFPVSSVDVRHTYRTLSDEEKETLKYMKDLGQEFIEFLQRQTDSREIRLAVTKLEEAVMWASKGLTA